MKKLISILGVSLVVVFFTSCFEEVDNWYTNTSQYDGRFTVAMTCDEYSDDNTTITDGEELLIYNSAANVENEIIIDASIAGIHVRGKFQVTGDPQAFKGQNESSNLSYKSELLTSNGYYIYYNGSLYDPAQNLPEEAGEEIDGIQSYARVSMEEGKITPLSKTTIGGNKSDGVYVNVTLYTDAFIFEGYETPQDTWANPKEPEFAWRIKVGSRENFDGAEEHWTLDGYRYTGYPEDNPSTQPPIIEK